MPHHGADGEKPGLQPCCRRMDTGLTTFLSAEEVLLSCSVSVPRSLSGVQIRECGHTSPVRLTADRYRIPQRDWCRQNKLLRTPEKAADYRSPE
nr:hypothetical protein [Escherichia coli O25b:H4-ST131]